MAVKYYFEFTDLENILHRVDISNDDFVGSSTEINGSIEIDYPSIENTLEAIRGSALTLSLEASTLLDFEDLYTENPKYWKVEYTRDSIGIFSGFLNPEGLFQDFVSDKWIITLDVSDGLGFLESLSYVDNSTGLQFTGRQKELDVLVNCLKRTGLQQDINTSIDIYYTGLSTSLNVLDNTYLNASRFIKDDGTTIMNCEEVLRNILEPYGACISQYNNAWYIYKPNQLFSDSEQTFFSYNYLGVANAPATQTIDFAKTIGSQINGFQLFHVNSNQSLSIKNSIGAYRINYKYGLVNSLLENIFLEHNGVTIDEWTINSSTNLTLNPSGLGVDFIFDSTSSVLNMTSDNFSINEGDRIKFSLGYITTEAIATIEPPSGLIYGDFYSAVKIDDGINIYTYNGSLNQWDMADNNVSFNTTIGEEGFSLLFTRDLIEAPVSGDMYIEIRTPEGTGTAPGNETDGIVYLTEVGLSPLDSQTTSLEGENHTFQREDNPSTKIENTKEVFTGDNPSEIYVGTIYKTDASSPTETWFRKGKTEAKELIRIMGEETMRVNASPSRFFSGDIYGYIPYISVITIDGITGVFIVMSYKYNAYENITSLELKQIFGAELTDINYEKTFDYGNVVEPTIKG